MSTEPKSFKDISIKGILLALLIFTVTMGISALAAYHMPNQIKLIGDITISFLLSIFFTLVMNSRDKAIESHENTTDQMANGHNKFIQRVFYFWVIFFILISIVKMLVSR